MLIERNSNALPLFFTETVYIVPEEQQPGGSDKEIDGSEKTTSNTEVNTTLPLSSIPYAGQNLKKILILFENKLGKELPVNEQDFLGKVLQAVNLSFDDVALVNIHLLEQTAYLLLSQFEASIWLSFGVVRDSLPVNANVPLYEIAKANKTSLLLADSLEEIERNRDKKVLLWNNLKILFQ